MRYIPLFVLLLCVSLAGCASRSTIVALLPDPDGGVGAVEVRGQSGETRTLEAPNQAVQAKQGEPLAPPYAMSTGEVALSFGSALDALPSSPAVFVLHFLDDSMQLSKETRSQIPLAAQAVKDRGSVDTSVTGHAARQGPAAANAALARARKVGNMLVQEGVDPDILSIESHGAADPVAATPESVADPRNRRVEIIVR